MKSFKPHVNGCAQYDPLKQTIKNPVHLYTSFLNCHVRAVKAILYHGKQQQTEASFSTSLYALASPFPTFVFSDWSSQKFTLSVQMYTSINVSIELSSNLIRAPHSSSSPVNFRLSKSISHMCQCDLGHPTYSWSVKQWMKLSYSISS